MAELLTRRRNHAIWLGLLMVLIGLITYPPTLRIPALRDFPWVNLPLIIAGVCVSGLGLWRAIRQPASSRGKVTGGIGLIASSGLAVFFVYSVFVLGSHLPLPTHTVPPSAAAPDFELPDQNGMTVRLSDFRGNKVVLTFYRGYW